MYPNIYKHPSLGENGRLGNQLFQIASTIGIALDNHCYAVFNAWWSYQKYFQNPIDVIPQFMMGYQEGAVYNYEEPCFHYIPLSTDRFVPVAVSHDIDNHSVNVINLKGYFQSEKYWENHREHIYKTFEFEKSFREKWENVMKDIKASAPGRKIISIHMRFGDYIGNPFYADLKQNGYYQRAIQNILFTGIKEERPLFLLFSDDIKAAGEHLEKVKQEIGNFEYLIITSSTSEITDLCLMSLCSGHIIANSSFSWWGAYLSKSKNVVAPAKWFGDIAGFDTKDLYLPHMVRL